MTWFKFLSHGAVGLFSGFRWPRPDATGPGEWVYAAGALDLCRNGLHACRPADLPYWLQEELYVVELDGQVIEHERLVLARRGRLRERVDAWSRESAYEFSSACALRVRDWAADALARSGRAAHADGLLACRRVEDLRGTATGIAESAGDLGNSLVGYTADTAHTAVLVESGKGWAASAAATGFIAAAAAGAAAGVGYVSATTTERLRQAGWIADLART